MQPVAYDVSVLSCGRYPFVPRGYRGGSDSGAACEGLGLHALLESAYLQRAVRKRRNEIHVRTFGGEFGIPAQFGSFSGHVDSFDIIREQHEMPGACVEEPSTEHPLQTERVYHLQSHDAAAAVPGENLAGVQPVGSFEHESLSFGWTNAEKVGERHYAAASVAAHHASGTVGVIVFHTEVGIC